MIVAGFLFMTKSPAVSLRGFLVSERKYQSEKLVQARDGVDDLVHHLVAGVLAGG